MPRAPKLNRGTLAAIQVRAQFYGIPEGAKLRATLCASCEGEGEIIPHGSETAYTCTLCKGTKTIEVPLSELSGKDGYGA